MQRIIVTAIALCCWALSTPRASAATLFNELGEQPGLNRLVESAAAAWLADPRVASTFDNTNMERFRRLLADQLCQLTGGGCAYRGRDMRASHVALDLDTRQFNAVVEGLQHAMDEQGIPFRVQNRLLALLAPMHRDIVSR